MSDLIDRDEVIEIIEYVCSADDTYWKPGTLEKIHNLPTHETPFNTLNSLDCVERQQAIDLVESFYKIDKSVLNIMVFNLKQLPSVQPRKGKWHGKGDSEGFGIFICDNCGKFAMMEFDFCPNCGSYNGGKQK